jgi:hypothetical protein
MRCARTRVFENLSIALACPDEILPEDSTKAPVNRVFLRHLVTPRISGQLGTIDSRIHTARDRFISRDPSSPSHWSAIHRSSYVLRQTARSSKIFRSRVSAALFSRWMSRPSLGLDAHGKPRGRHAHDRPSRREDGNALSASGIGGRARYT